MTDLPIERALAEAGFDTPRAARRARAVLEDVGLTRSGKARIAADKRARISAVLSEVLIGACPDAECQRLAANRGLEVLPVTRSACAVCGGGDNRRAVLRLLAACAAHRVTRVLIIGGTPATRGELGRLGADSDVELRCVDAIGGVMRQRDADQDMAWAQVMAIWAPTPLPHKVSNLYARPRNGLLTTICPRRGIAALAEDIIARLG